MLKRTLLLITALSLLVGAIRAEAQQRQVTGRVVGAAGGAPLAGAQVVIAGTTRGTTTDAQGNFTLTVPDGNARLRVSRIGYLAQEVPAPAGQGSMVVQLAQDVLNIEGIVVTGQATTVARRNLANAVSTVAAQDVERAPSQTVDKALAGKVPGAIISTNSGAPGGGVQVDLRGVSSINASADPLWVIDGVIVSNVAISSGQNAVTGATGNPFSSNQDVLTNRVSDINPEDIESIEILKGPSAAAIYGSKASNGVILVTTKRGRAGAPRVSVGQRLGYYSLSNTLGSRSFTREEAMDKATGLGLSAAQADQYFDANGQPKQVFDQERLLAGRRDLSTETSVSVSGGTENTRYYVGGLVQDDEGIIANTGFEKQSLRINLDQKLGSRVEVGVNSNFLHTVAARGLTNNDNTNTSFYMALSGTPNFVDLRGDGAVFPTNPFTSSNPIQTAALMSNDEDVWRLIGAGNIKVELMATGSQSLRLLGSGGVDFFQQENELFFPPELQFEAAGKQPGTSVLGNSDNLNLNGNLNLVHVLTPSSSAFTATTSAGLQFEDRDLNISRIVARNLVAGQRNVNSGPSPQVFEFRQRVQDLGLYVQEELLMLDNRLLLTAGIRGDRSSANGDPEEYFLYPKASASFRVPDFMGGVDELKLRAAYGETGNQPLYGQKFTSLDATQSIQGRGGLVVAGTAGDPDIRPERTKEVEGGFDLTLLDSRATLEFTAYDQRITDLLLQRNVAPSTGFTTQFFNGGELHTRGIEAALAATPIRGEGFNWFTRTTFYRTRSTIEELPVPTFRTGAFGSTALGVFQIEEGKSATQIVGREVIDGKVQEIPLGDATPDFKMGFTNELTFGPLSVYSLFDWQKGGEIINLTRLLFDAYGNSPDYELPAGVASPRTIDQCYPGCSGLERISGFGRFTKQYIEDGSFVKLREFSLSYQIPGSVLGRLPGGFGTARISLAGRNLLTWTDYTGLDPEVSNFGSQQIARNVDVAPFPPSRSFWLSFDVGF